MPETQTTPEEEFSHAELAACAEQELRMRRSVYQKRADSAHRTLLPKEEREIAMMARIAKDYREAEQLLAELPTPAQVFPPACGSCAQRPSQCLCEFCPPGTPAGPSPADNDTPF